MMRSCTRTRSIISLHVVDQADRTAWASGELTEDIGPSWAMAFWGVVVGTAILLNGETSHVLGTQFTEFLASDFRIRPPSPSSSELSPSSSSFIFVFAFVGEM